VYAGQELSSVMQTLKITPDFEYRGAPKTTSLRFIHRALPDADIYFVANRTDQPADVSTLFRIAGRRPELWYPDSAQITLVSFYAEGGRTRVPLHMEPWETVFVVFRRSTTQTSFTAPVETESPLMVLSGPWQVTFQPNRGAPSFAAFDQLVSFHENADDGIKYFSGHATYTKSIEVKAAWFTQGRKFLLDLGDVKNLADIQINGKSLGIVWHAPYRTDATSALKPGDNTIEIKVTNAWVNRLIGDEQPNVKQKITSTTYRPYTASSPLVASGLLGPVRLLAVSGSSVRAVAPLKGSKPNPLSTPERQRP
jgi:alpha-L-rhamnosidase